jgi:hypothetical protein
MVNDEVGVVDDAHRDNREGRDDCSDNCGPFENARHARSTRQKRRSSAANDRGPHRVLREASWWLLASRAQKAAFSFPVSMETESQVCGLGCVR